ncbi:MAG: FeoB-associated Cys-rich membrane protein [Phycisphaerae bacterium]|nr:FeoB-associated Cys-rich membrane protein [Phycisphaerae bacterium]
MERVLVIFIVVLATLALGFFAFRKGKRCGCGHGGECKGEQRESCANSAREKERS